MNLSLLLVLLVPLITPWIAKVIFGSRVTFLSIGAALLAGVVATTAVYYTSIYAQTTDVEIWNGQVTDKTHERVSCSHSYECMCSTDSKGNRSCSTCYEHPYDVNWVVKTTVGDIEIDRVNRQGTDTPPRWTAVTIGEPVAQQHSFTNYVKAVPDSLFHQFDTKKFDALIPPYPSNVYDYYKLNRVLPMGVPLPNLALWNQDLSLALRPLGPAKQANAIIVLVNTADQSYLHALEGKWIGGKKNDIIVIIGTTQYPKIDWVAVSSWTDQQMFKVQLRDDIFALGEISREGVIKAIETNTIKSFKRKKMKDFEYLKNQIEPPVWVLILAAMLGIVSSLGAIYAVEHHLGQSRYGYRTSYRNRRFS